MFSLGTLAFGQAAPVQPVAPRQDWQNSWYTGEGGYLGDQEAKTTGNQSYWYNGDQNNPTNDDGVAFSTKQGYYYLNTQHMVPHTDDVATQVSKYTANGAHASDLHAMRDMTNTETARMQKDTGAMGQAMSMNNNSTLSKDAQKPYVAGSAGLFRGVNAMNSAGNNTLLAETFSGCSDSIQQVTGTDGGNQYQTKSCSFVQLKFTPGVVAHVFRTVTATFPNVWDIEDFTNQTVASGASVTMTGTLYGYEHQDNWPSTTNFLTDFTVDFLQITNPYVGPPASEFSYVVNTMPTAANSWYYSVTVTRNAAATPLPAYDDPSYAVNIRFHWDYQGDPIYNFTPPNCDSGDCTIQGDEFCKAKWTCNSKAPVMSTNGYLVPLTAFNDTTPGPLYTLNQLLDPNYTADMQTDLICMDATETIDCSGIYSGTYCVPSDPTNPNSTPVCSTVPPPTDGSLPNDCPQIAADPTCHEAGEVCADDGQSLIDGYCYVMTKQYVCYVPTTVGSGDVTTVTQCPGNQPCMDGSCTTYDKRNEHGYSRTKALGQQVIAQHFLNDWETNDEYTTDPLNLTDNSNAGPPAQQAAAAMADYQRLLKAQERKLKDHPSGAAKLLDAAKEVNDTSKPSAAAGEKDKE